MPALSKQDKPNPTTELIMTTTKGSASNEGKVAIVTGSSRGIGASIARRLASEGFTVIVNYRVFFSDLTREPLQYLIRSHFEFHL